MTPENSSTRVRQVIELLRCAADLCLARPSEHSGSELTTACLWLDFDRFENGFYEEAHAQVFGANSERLTDDYAVKGLLMLKAAQRLKKRAAKDA